VTAAFCVRQDAIAVGSRDGVLGLWCKLPGLPTAPVKEIACRDKARLRGDSSGVQAWIMDRPLLRPMMHVKPEGNKTDPEKEDRQPLQASDFFVRSDLRSLSRTASAVYSNPYRKGQTAVREKAKPSPVTPDIRAKLNRRKASLTDVGAIEEIDVGGGSLEKSFSTPALKRWNRTGYGYEDVLSAYCNATTEVIKPVTPNQNLFHKTCPGRLGGLGFRPNSSGAPRGRANSTSTNASDIPEDGTALSNDMAALRLSMARQVLKTSCVRRISLDPQSIC